MNEQEAELSYFKHRELHKGVQEGFFGRLLLADDLVAQRLRVEGTTGRVPFSMPFFLNCSDI